MLYVQQEARHRVPSQNGAGKFVERLLERLPDAVRTGRKSEAGNVLSVSH